MYNRNQRCLQNNAVHVSANSLNLSTYRTTVERTNNLVNPPEKQTEFDDAPDKTRNT